jgi:hypothetical protein
MKFMPSNRPHHSNIFRYLDVGGTKPNPLVLLKLKYFVTALSLEDKIIFTHFYSCVEVLKTWISIVSQ